MKNFEIEVLKIEYDTHKIVKYFTSQLTVPTWVTYIATDSNGNVFGYRHKPVVSSNGPEWVYGIQRDAQTLSISIGHVKFRGEWKDSLKKV
jgi:hypothetical protein